MAEGHVIVIGGAEDKVRDRLILGRFVALAGGPDARIKRLYRIDLTGVAPDASVTKTLVRDLLPVGVRGFFLVELRDACGHVVSLAPSRRLRVRLDIPQPGEHSAEILRELGLAPAHAPEPMTTTP